MPNFDALRAIATTIRGLSMDAIDAANSGHPGLPLGCAELLAYLYGHGLRHVPDNSQWVNRDRLVLSAGHGSAGLYAALHLAGFNVSMDDLAQFRQLHSNTAGHPEYGLTDGVEATTGPLGQGVGMGVGMALAMKMMGQTFPHDPNLFDAKVFILAGDGCIMEGVSSEASSLAGHLQLDNVVLIYDSNRICLDGDTDECFSDNVAMRYESYGWHVVSIDGHSLNQIHDAVTLAHTIQAPTLIVANTTIGYGSLAYEGTSEAHGKPFGRVESTLVKRRLGHPEDDFFVPESVHSYFREHRDTQRVYYQAWQSRYESWRDANPTDAAGLDSYTMTVSDPESLSAHIRDISIEKNKATRVQSSACLQSLATVIPNLRGGSADLSCSDNTFLTQFPTISANDFTGRNIKYGVREFAMASMASGMALTRLIRPYIGTFLVFSDYMRNAIRLSGLMGLPVVYQFTHDSILLGEDGPTHQPVEHLASLRAMPGVTVCRPADETEVKAAWYMAMVSSNPTVIALSRQATLSLDETDFDAAKKGGYVLRDCEAALVTLFATGTECGLAMTVSDQLATMGIASRVVSLMSWELFYDQPVAYRRAVIGTAAQRVSIEAASSFGWERIVGDDGMMVSVDTFGLSAKQGDLVDHFGLHPATIADAIQAKLHASTH